MAAAAIVGAKNGRKIGASMIRAEMQIRNSLVQAIQHEEQRMVEKVLRTYSKDGSEGLSPEELAPMLEDYSEEVFGKPVVATRDHIEFLLRLCNTHHTNRIEKSEVVAVTEVWSSFLRKKHHIGQLFERHADDADYAVTPVELQDVLEELHGSAVPWEVTTWVLQQADICGDGALHEMELARAMCALERWERQGRRKSSEKLDPDRIGVGIKMDGSLPPPPQSKACAIL